MYTPTQFSSAADKRKFTTHFWRFRKSGYKKTLFYKWFYVKLSMMFGHMAHYNQEGFYEEMFESSHAIDRFERHIRTHAIYGSPAYTWSDVELEIQHTLTARLGRMP